MSDKVKLSDLKPDTKNSNKGTARGLKMIEASLQQDGFGRSILVDKHGNIVAGNKTVESVANTFGVDTEVIVVKTNGNQVVAVQREDLDLTDQDPNSKARRLAYRDNLAHEFSFELDPAQVMADIEAGFDFEAIDISLPDLGELLKTEGEAVLKEKNEVLKPKKYARVLISIPIDSAIDAKSLIDELGDINGIEIDYGAN